MGLTGKLLSALVLTYFASRISLRLPNPLRKAWGISLAHLVALLVLIVALAVIRGSEGGFPVEGALVLVPPQIFWWLLDLLREHGLGFMKRGSGQQTQ